jgi:hypothetical protein
MKHSYCLICLLLLANLVPRFVKAQKNEISVLPVRTFFDSFNGNLDFRFAYQYIEFEHQLTNKLSLNTGLGYNFKKKEYENSTSRTQSLLLSGGLKYYLNKNNNMSGFYTGLNVLFSQYNNNGKGVFEGDFATVKESNIAMNYYLTEPSLGYKYCILKNRLAIDLSVRSNVSLYDNFKFETTYIDDTKTTFNNSSNNWGISVPFMDLRIGYRFGFKK